VTRLVLLPSPLTGAAVWEPVAVLLRERGRTVTVARLDRPVRTPADVLAGFRAHLAGDEDPVLVAHSNAGVYVAALAATRSVSGIVLVDAGLPSTDAGTPTAPPAFREHLGRLPRDGDLLPPWTDWWPGEDVARLFPDQRTRTRVEAQQPRLPLGYFDDRVPSPPGWERVPAAYLGFGATYAEEQAEARRRGWPVVTVPGEHLHLLVDPVRVADELDRLVTGLTVSCSVEAPATD
jgi:hypothetical protein